jgi:hypothetical protein
VSAVADCLTVAPQATVAGDRRQRLRVRWLLEKYGYSPDLSEDATPLILKQAELSLRRARRTSRRDAARFHRTRPVGQNLSQLRKPAVGGLVGVRACAMQPNPPPFVTGDGPRRKLAILVQDGQRAPSRVGHLGFVCREWSTDFPNDP